MIMSLVLLIALIVLCVFVMSSYLFADALLPPNYTHSERVVIGILSQISVIIILGQLYSWAYIFTQETVTVTFAALVFISTGLYIKSGRVPSLVSRLKEESKSVTTQVVFLSIVAFFILSLTYESTVPLVQGWDRGIHFTNFLDILNNAHSSDTYPGTRLNNFYLLGVEFFLSFMTMTCGKIAGLQGSLDPSVFVAYAPAYDVMWALIGCIWPAVAYATANRISSDRHVATLSTLVIIFMAGREISRVGSIGTSLGYLGVAGIMILIYARGQASDWSPGISSLFFVLIATMTVLTHIITTLFITIIMLVFGTRYILTNSLHWRQKIELILEAMVAAVLTILILYLFANSLFNGILQEFARKSSTTASEPDNIILYWSSYIGRQIQGLSFGMDLSIIPILMMGIFVGRRWKTASDFVLYIVICITVFLLPLIEFPRAIYYFVLPMCLISAEGLHALLEWSGSNARPFRRQINPTEIQVLLVALILVPGTAMQAWVATYPGPYREHSELDEEMFHVYAIAQWVTANIDREAVIAYPNSGAQGRLFELVVSNEVLFADRRYPDIPDYVQIARLYDSENLTWDDRTAIIQGYDISVIITGFSYLIANVTEILNYYPTMVHFNLYDYNIIVLYADYYVGM